tara:strand:- start:29 stop:598 length:570 start_codon:yes stop_codon:yes gene_type:complete
VNKITRDKELLSKLLDIPANMVFKRRSEISLFCLKELENAVDLPKGYKFSRQYRIPKPGDYFLDLEILTKDHRLLVYRAKQYGSSPKIIMKCVSSSPQVKFCIDECINEDSSYAIFSGEKVRLLNPYVDSTSRVAVLTSTDKILLVHIEELANVKVNYPHKNRLNKWFELTDTEKQDIADLEEDIFGLN